MSPNIVHSIDRMVARELHRRCDYDPKQIERVRRSLGRTRTRESEDSDRIVTRLWRLYEQSGLLSSRILGYLGPDNMGHVDPKVIQELLGTLPAKPFPVISIHDCFRVHPNYANDLRRTYNQFLSEIAGSDMLAFIASQVTGTQIQVTKAGDISKKILGADYALC